MTMKSSSPPRTDLARAAQLLERVGLDSTGLPPRRAVELAAAVDAILASPVPVPPDDGAILWLFRYPVPKLGPGGTCSLAHELEEEPFDLRAGTPLAGFDPSRLRDHPETRRLTRLRELVLLLGSSTAADWAGIYRRLPGEPGALCKEAYTGRPSRAVFPLTAEFAATSNNSTAVLSGLAIVVEDVEAHVASGKPYYECDAEVKSELCLPIPDLDDPRERVVGLIDLESFRPARFGRDEAWMAALVAEVMVRAGLLGGPAA